jgi:phosphoribosylformimino-5-aminoimidazole carboxamide ribotide isomerase
VRRADQAAQLLALGVQRIVLGTVLVRSPEDVAAWVKDHGPRFAAGVDAANGNVRVAGWTEETGRRDTDVAAGLAGLGIRWLVYTNIDRDGTLSGPDIPRTNAAARAADLPTLLSGGIGSERDVDQVARQKDPLVVGVILGKALYEGRVDLAELIRRFPQDDDSSWDPSADA